MVVAAAWTEAAHVEEGEQNPFLAEPKIDGHQISKAPHEQQRSHDEHQGNRDLHHDKEALERKALAGGGETAPSGLDGGARFDMRGAKGGREAEDGAGECANRCSEGEHTPVRGQLEMQRIALRAQKIEDALAQCAREHQPECGPSPCEQQTLAQRLPNQPAAGSPERQAHRKFTLPGAGAGKHEIGEIGARDQQDEAGDPEE